MPTGWAIGSFNTTALAATKTTRSASRNLLD
jgi:hypothetical protein